jgi:hypothetical protein
LIDAMAFALPLGPEWKQAILNEARVGRRLDQLRQAIRGWAGEDLDSPAPRGGSMHGEG